MRVCFLLTLSLFVHLPHDYNKFNTFYLPKTPGTSHRQGQAQPGPSQARFNPSVSARVILTCLNCKCLPLPALTQFLLLTTMKLPHWHSLQGSETRPHTKKENAYATCVIRHLKA